VEAGFQYTVTSEESEKKVKNVPVRFGEASKLERDPSTAGKISFPSDWFSLIFYQNHSAV
jgi:hypothetical protein